MGLCLTAISGEARAQDQPFIGEIRLFSGKFAPAGWRVCDGRLLSISDNEALYMLIGTTYGGDGELTFALPDFRGRFPIEVGLSTGSAKTYFLGEKGGRATVQLSINQLPSHMHTLQASPLEGTIIYPENGSIAQGQTAARYNVKRYTEKPADAVLAAATASPSGGGQPVDIRPRYLSLTFIIAVEGVFPNQN